MFAVPAEPVIEAPCPAEARSLDRRVECGFVRVPLDRATPNGRKIRIYFERYPRRDRSNPRVATVVSIEGGPGYGTTPDRSGRVELWRPVSQRRSLVLVDLRGTGKSGALACAAFAKKARGYPARAGRCAAQLGPKRDVYTTSQSVRDVEAVLRSLRAGRIDLYGDSYGSYAAQAYALRYPGRLRSLTLDSTYPLPGTDPAWADLLAAIRHGLRLACARSPDCPLDVRKRDPVRLVAGLAAQVRTKPILGFAPDGDGTRTRVRLNEDALVQVVSSGYYYPALWRDLLAAAIAARRGDNAPILRLAAETVTVEAGPADPPSWSEALYVAVTCRDYPQLWDPWTPVALRPAQVAARLAAYPRGTFTPFTASAWTGTDYEGALACLRWPLATRFDPAVPPGATYPDVPTLILQGDLDTITAAKTAREVARNFRRSTFVVLRNSFHVTALYDRDECASRLYIRFLRHLDAGDTSCAKRVPETHVVRRFPVALRRTAPARPLPKDDSRRRDRRLAAAAAATAADVIARWFVNYDGTSVGLRGGRWSYIGDDPVVFTLRNVRFVPQVRVSGKVRWSPVAGGVKAFVRVRDGNGHAGTLKLRWSLARRHAVAIVRGQVDGRTLRAATLAP